jgi:hypothetical protein
MKTSLLYIDTQPGWWLAGVHRRALRLLRLDGIISNPDITAPMADLLVRTGQLRHFRVVV